MDTLRNYQPDDLAACLGLFDENVPAFFAAEERSAFVRFLTRHAAQWNYQVLERAGQVVASAGYALGPAVGVASLCWGMVHPRLHRQGLGTVLLQARLRALRARPDIAQVVLDTSQHTQAFYARFGFVATRVVPGGYGPGLDKWDMALALETSQPPYEARPEP